MEYFFTVKVPNLVHLGVYFLAYWHVGNLINFGEMNNYQLRVL